MEWISLRSRLDYRYIWKISVILLWNICKENMRFRLKLNTAQSSDTD